MTFKPAHKDTTRPPGQIVNEVTLADYLHNKEIRYATLDKKMTFKEWLKKSSFVVPDETVYCWLEDCWYAAQENAPSQAPGTGA